MWICSVTEDFSIDQKREQQKKPVWCLCYVSMPALKFAWNFVSLADFTSLFSQFFSLFCVLPSALTLICETKSQNTQREFVCEFVCVGVFFNISAHLSFNLKRNEVVEKLRAVAGIFSFLYVFVWFSTESNLSPYILLYAMPLQI